ncbi:MAG: GNAT family N-acetyltransferase [Duodenibacillus sp.]
MTSFIVYNKPFVVNWVSKQLPGKEDFPLDSPSIGLIRDGRLIAGVVYTMYTGNGICMSVAGTGRKWLTREFLYVSFAYPFVQLGCSRVSGLVRVDNHDAQRFDEHLGFVKEGVIRKGDDDGTDLILYGMLKEDCRWLKLKDRKNG